MDEQQTQQPTQPAAPQGNQSDVDKNKAIAIVGYIIPILFFIPLLSDDGKKSAYAKFHANQQLNLLLFWIIGWIVATILYVILIGFIIQLIVWIAGIVFMIMGIINASKGEMKKLPLIGGYTILK
jgi:uncharacterized membrane protein